MKYLFLAALIFFLYSVGRLLYAQYSFRKALKEFEEYLKSVK